MTPTFTTPNPFSDLRPGPDGLAEGLKRYRRLALIAHADVGGDNERMVNLNLAWGEAEPRLRGAGEPLVTITSRRHTYSVVRPLVRGDVADLHLAEVDDEEVVLKVARHPRDADLLEAEVASLKTIHADNEDGRNGWFPWVEDSFAFASPGKPRRRATALEPLYGFYDLNEVFAAHDHIQPRDTAWIARRVLHCLAQAHHAGRVHGGLVPAHVMVHPAMHRVVLVGWGGSVQIGQPLLAQVANYKDWYPAEAADKEPCGPETDLFMFGRLLWRMAAGMSGSVPNKRYRAFGSGCSLLARKQRPKDAHEVLAEFDDLLDRMWGKRTFHEFTMPRPSRI